MPLGRYPPRSSCTTPMPIPPQNASGRLVRLPKAAAAMAATSRSVKLSACSSANKGASSTPARPARRLERTQIAIPTRSELMPASWTMRGLSAMARMRRPIWVKCDMSDANRTMAKVTMTVDSSVPLMASPATWK